MRSKKQTSFINHHNQILIDYLNIGIKHVKILSANNACTTCKIMCRNRYRLSDLIKKPILPSQACVHQFGYCRCTYIADYDGYIKTLIYKYGK